MEKKRKIMARKNGIDLFRLIGAFSILCVNTDYGSLDQYYVDSIRLISRWAIPFYFMTSGFFLASKIDDQLGFQRIQKNVSMLISILIILSIIYLPVGLMKGYAPSKISNIFTGSYFHLWFIGSLITGYIFIWYLYFVQKSRYLPYISFFILLFAVVSDSYDQLFHLSINFELFIFLLSIPFMYMGIFISKKGSSMISKKLLIIIILIGMGIQFIEAELFFKIFEYDRFTHQFLIGTIIASIPLFILSTKINIKENRFSRWGRDHSLFIYLYHPLLYLIIWFLAEKIAPSYFDFLKGFAPIIGFSIALSVSLFLNRYFPRVYSFMNGNLQIIRRKSTIKLNLK
jgi:hypothetical protein